MNELNRDTLKLLQSVLHETWSSLRPEEQASGERDPVRLRKKAMAEVVACAMPEEIL